MDPNNYGSLSRKAIFRILETIGLYGKENYFKEDDYTFDHFLSVLGEI